MIYTPLTKLAMNIAYNAHQGQLDKAGVPYIYHPIHLAEQMDDEESVCVALLHDVLEDTDMTAREIEDYGFGAGIIRALELLRHEKGTDYMEYIIRLSTDPTAVKVKLADLRHNSDLSRIDTIDGSALKRAEKYRAAIKILEKGEVE